MKIIERFQIDPEVCAYLGDRPSTIEYVLVRELSAGEYENLMNKGWRKFGPLLFHPICRDCQECRPIRVLAERFAPSRSQRRSLRDNIDLTVSFERPAATEERVDLYNLYHRWRQQKRGWPETVMSVTEYQALVVNNPIHGEEIVLRDGGKLIGIMQLDFTNNVISDVYHFYDPSYEARGIGTFLILQTISLARERKKPWVYLGYHVKGSRSMEYKKRYRPNEIMGFDGVWRSGEEMVMKASGTG